MEMVEFWGGPLPPSHNEKNPERDAESEAQAEAETIEDLDYAAEIKRLQAYRQKLDHHIEVNANSKSMGDLVQAYALALDKELALRQQLKMEQQPQQKSTFPSRSKGGLQPRLK